MPLGIPVDEDNKVLPDDPKETGPAIIKDEWIQQVIDAPESEKIQDDRRIRRWGKITEMENRFLRVVLLPDGETVHNAFFDRGHKP